MSARLARTAFSSAARRAQATASSSAGRLSRRTMVSHGAAPTKSSDTPWIIGSLIVFGPAFLYLVSPSGRKNAHSHSAHHEKHDNHALNKPAEPAAETTAATVPETKVETEEPASGDSMKDDEGTEANVASSIALAESGDVPKASQSPEDQVALQTSAEADKIEASEDAAPQSEAKEESSTDGPKTGTFQEADEEGPTDLSKAREATKKGAVPKRAAANRN